MLKLIRKNTFETNSSSCHTIVLLSKDVPKTTSVETTLCLSTGEYDCGPEIYTDVFNKLNYLFTFISVTGDCIEDFVSSLQEYFPNLKTIETDKGTYSLQKFKEILLDNHEYFLTEEEDYIGADSISLAYRIFDDMTFSEYLSEDCTLYVVGDSSNVFVDETKAETLGITEDMAQQLTGDEWYTSELYEMNSKLRDKIVELGGKVFT